MQQPKEIKVDGENNVQPEWGTPEWVADFTERYGMPPIAGGESVGDPAAAGGEGDAGDSGQGESQGLYDLESVPEEYRDHVERIAKEMEGNATRKFQEHAQYREQWAPYEELGVTEYDPEAMQQLLSFAELTQDEEAFKEWWTRVGQEYDWVDEGDNEPEYDPETGEPIEPDDGGYGDLSAEDIEAMVEERVQEALNPVMEAQAMQEQQQLIAEAENDIDGEIAALKDEHGDFNEEDVFRLALAYAGEPDMIQKAFADYQRMVSETERRTLTERNGYPPPPEGPGVAPTQEHAPTSMKEAGEMAKARLRAANSGQ